jgi:ribosomal protein S12 methylthiotransferase accessory factor
MRDELHEDAGALAPFLSWIDQRFGPFQRFGGAVLAPPQPEFWLYSCTLAHTPAGTLFQPFSAKVGGTSIERGEALRRALGEAVERYSALTSHTRTEFRKIPLQDGDYFDKLPKCASDEPCPPTFKGEDPNAIVSHVEMRRLSDGLSVLVPAAYVHLGFTSDQEPPVTQPISTGVAFHTDLTSALWSGLCEVAERDAMMLAWWTQKSVPRIDCDASSIPKVLAERIERVRRAGLEPHFFDITTEFHVPTVFCILRGPKYPHDATGAACRADPASACAKALDEAVAVHCLMLHERETPLPSRDSFDWVHFLDQHAKIYAGGSLTHALDFLIMTPLSTSFSAFARGHFWPSPQSMDELSARARELELQGFSALWCDVTAEEVNGQGYVVRVFVPEMVPLSQAHGARWLGSPRLCSALGLSRPSAAAYYPYPHPFA